MTPSADDDDLDDLEEDADRSEKRARGRRGAASRRASALHPAPVRRWAGSGDVDDEGDPAEPAARKGRRPPVFWRARDSLYFEPLVALAIVAVLLASLFAYTSNWPPVYVIESNSMQHGSGDHLGALNAGDVVLAQKAPQSSIVTYVQGIRQGYSTYGESGDVLLYHPNGNPSVTPIIHRAIIYLQYDAHTQAYNATGLAGLPCGTQAGAVYATPGTTGECETTELKGDLELFHLGGRPTAIDISLNPSTGLGAHSGYITLGDNMTSNTVVDQQGLAISSLVEPDWVIGVARGMIPWFGALKLLLDGNSALVPKASWEFMGLTIAGVILAAAGIHFLLRRRGVVSPQRRREEELEEITEDDGRPPPPPPAANRPPMRGWQATPVAPDDDVEPVRPAPRRASYEQRRRAHFVTHLERRHARPPPKEGDGEDEDEAS